MPSNFLEKFIIFSGNPTWGKISLGVGGASSLSAIILPSTYSKVIFGCLAAMFLSLSIIVPRRSENVKITCIQNSPANSVENHHKNIFQIRYGVSRLETYIDIPSWSSKFRIKLDIDPSIEIIPLEDKPRSVQFENNVLKSDQDMNGFPVTLKLTGEPDELAKGQYILKFTDQRTDRLIKRIILKCDPDPPDQIDELEAENLDEDELEAW